MSDHTAGCTTSGFTALGPALLFCPADRPDRYHKAAAAADGVILDLEDAVAPGAKASAREALIGSDLDPARTVVRLNPAASAEFDRDLVALARTSYTKVMLAKAETATDLDRLVDLQVIALCESPLGVSNAGALAGHPSVVALMWGAEDLVAALGGSSSRKPDGSYRDFARYARSHVLIAAAGAGKVAYDAVHLNISDDAGLEEEAEDAAASGFAGTVCIHPRQVPIVRAAYHPSAESVAWATDVLAAADGAGNGVFAHRGQMVDEPVLRQARRVLTRASA
ncbi:citrate lyase subunit beta/citryl-CoA lyase [Nakamurella sp. UYEF19]|uniref:HpcH/HpaI aldolase/citrate lyase family protein n=1 Tax=Nakamurella sp. UYEF19 TaxID=1756392 RepID=UPI003399DF88